MRVLPGDSRPSRQRRPAPVPTPARGIDPPDFLNAEAREVWDRLAPDLIRRAVLTGWDVPAFAVLCSAIAHHRRAVAIVNAAGIVVDSGRPERGPVKNPALQIVRDQAAIVATFAAKFGLTPADRQTLHLPELLSATSGILD